ncbi:Uncharacterized conserved protein YybS, DUF2232 family [Paenibacillus uliginis N3/975]|uniref:Uncharacterized conserved protein YybS, DUF2232 family n=1 Tax=Paenibacillus uliginis N3/975 TaxID=1313296 RepID=A0A1X7HVP4_9BACL|nr:MULTISPECIES: DUF2232 domain-containing protein [Paenibacillus]UNK18458.1 YybS family protein [Paenibacillus sp. N3/727]SMF92842.1 Uncharacterized conserved protein YybS, DUF2232 family [Paenibacillus uliginis N3/975]
MKQRWTTVVWSVIYLLLLLSLLTPFSIVTAFLLILPVAILFTVLNVKSFILHLAPVWLMVALIHPVYAMLAAYFLVPGLVMGYWYRKRAPAMRVLKYGMAAMLLEMLLLLMIGTAFFQLNLSEYVDEIVQVTTAPLEQMGVNGGLAGQMAWTPEHTDALSERTMRMVPFALIISSFLMTVVTHALARPILNSMGISVPALKKAREWMLPRSLIWYYLIVWIMSVASKDSGSGFVEMIVINAMPLLQICFMIQALGFFFYLTHEKKWHPVVPFLAAIPIVLFPPMIILGILDLAFPLRQSISKKNG